MKSTKGTLLTRDEYYTKLRAGYFGECSFCEGEYKQLVLKKGTHWLWVASISPYWKYHTMFVPRRHIADIDELSYDEFQELVEMKKIALERFLNKDIKWSDGTPINTFSYMWRVRSDGIDIRFNVKKSTHLHMHMWPEIDGMQVYTIDPDATNWNPEVLRDPS